MTDNINKNSKVQMALIKEKVEQAARGGRRPEPALSTD